MDEPDVEAHGATDFERRLTQMEATRGDIVRRIEQIEQVNPSVLSARVAELADEVKALKRAFLTFGFTIIGGAIMFAFAVFELLGRG